MVRRIPALERVAIAGAFVAVIVLIAGAALRINHGRLGDFPHFYAAAEATRAGGDVLASGEGGYIYPPLLAFLLQPLTLVSQDLAAIIWLGINAALLAFATVLASREALRRFGLGTAAQLTALVASVGFLLTFDKTRATLNQEQTDSLVLLGFVLGLVWLERRPALAGVAIGFAANIKYLSLITIPYLIVRRKWAAAASVVASTVVWALVPAISLGWSGNLRALEQSFAGLLGAIGLSTQAGAANVHAVDWHLSLSVTSAVSRLVGPDGSPAMKGAIVGLVALAVLAAAWGIYRAKGRMLLGRGAESLSDPSVAATTALEWAGLIVASLAFGPQTTGRHLVLLLAVHPLGVVILLRQGPVPPKAILIGGMLLLQLAMVLPPGGERFEAAVDAWRAVGGASWCMLAMYLAMLWAGLPERGEGSLNPEASAGIKPVSRSTLAG